MRMQTHTSETKETRISMRVDPFRKAIIDKAAKIQHTTMSDFILENAYQTARQVIADETQILMSEEQFDHMCKLLDSPPKESLKRMKNLLNSKTILDN